MRTERILVVAAEAFELAGLLRRLDGRTRLDWPLRFASQGRNGRSSFLLVAHGPGPRLATEAADVARQRAVFDVVVSTGLCGALDPSLQVGDVFAASRILALETGETFAAEVCEPAPKRRYAEGLLCSMDRVAVTARDKAGLRTRGGAAVDMEAAAVARRSREWNLPFYCLRAVSDTAVETFSMDWNKMRDSQGRFRRGRIVLSALARPDRRMPELIRLWRRGRSCAEILGELLANCRF